jgi:hypothetical protein
MFANAMIKIDYITHEKLNQNADIDSCHSRFRKESPNEPVFRNLEEARRKCYLTKAS